MPQPNHATDSPLRALAPCHPALQLGCVQERCRTHADGMEIFLPGVPPETAVLLPRICQPPHRAVLSGTRNRIRPVALLLHGDGLDGLEPLTSAFGSEMGSACPLGHGSRWARSWGNSVLSTQNSLSHGSRMTQNSKPRSRRLKATPEPPVARRSPSSASPGPLTLIGWLAMVRRCLTFRRKNVRYPPR